MLGAYLDFRDAVSNYSFKYRKKMIGIICAITIPYFIIVGISLYSMFFEQGEKQEIYFHSSMGVLFADIVIVSYLLNTKWKQTLKTNMYRCNISDLTHFFEYDGKTLAILNNVKENDKKISVLLDENARVFEMYQKRNSVFCHIAVFSATVLVGALVYPLSSRHVVVGDLIMPLVIISFFVGLTFLVAIGSYPIIIQLCYGNELNVGYILRNQQIANSKS